MSADDIDISDEDFVGAVVARLVMVPAAGVHGKAWAWAGRLCLALQRCGFSPQDVLGLDGGRAMTSVLDLVVRNQDVVPGQLDDLWTKVAAHARHILDTKHKAEVAKRERAEAKRELAELKQELADVEHELAEAKPRSAARGALRRYRQRLKHELQTKRPPRKGNA